MSTTAVLNNERLWHVETCDVLAGLRSLPDCCVQCVVTSPPYYALRDYGIDGQIGLEETPDDYIAKMVAVFAEVRRVLRDDGTCWLNIGDSYASQGGERAYGSSDGATGRGPQPKRAAVAVKPKDLMGIPWLLAFALRADGWYLRSEIIWHKPNPMPESVTDRPSKAHEQIFLLTKSSRYFYDGEAIRTPHAPKTFTTQGIPFGNGRGDGSGMVKSQNFNGSLQEHKLHPCGAAKRSVWSIATAPYAEAHFATFPPALPETCLKAGTSAKGCCSICGAPWQRVTESERVPTRPGDGSKVHGANSRVNKSRDPAHASEANGKKTKLRQTAAHRDDIDPEINWRNSTLNSEVVGNRDPQRHVTTTITKGWEPGCDCDGECIPCLTLDPFNGAGTTGLVASKGLGLRYIGFELNPEYADMARRRINRGFVESTPKVESAVGQKSLFSDPA